MTKATSNKKQAQATKAPEKKAEATKATKKQAPEKKAPIKLADKREAFKAQLKLAERVAFEDEKTAVNGANSAMISCDNCIMLTLASEDGHKATRIIEIWAHRNRNDVCISKKSFNSVAQKAPELEAYRAKIGPAKSSKYVFKLADDEAIMLANLYMANI